MPVGDRWVRVEAFVLATEYQRAAFARRATLDSDLGPIAVVAPEDLVLHKLLADRPRDRADIADLFLVAGALNLEYLRHWARRLGVEDRLDVALREAGRR